MLIKEAAGNNHILNKHEDRQDPGGPHVGPMNLAIWGFKLTIGSGTMDNKTIGSKLTRNRSFVSLIFSLWRSSFKMFVWKFVGPHARAWGSVGIIQDQG